MISRSSTTTSRAAISCDRAVVSGVKKPSREVRPREAITPLRVLESSSRISSRTVPISVAVTDWRDMISRLALGVRALTWLMAVLIAAVMSVIWLFTVVDAALWSAALEDDEIPEMVELIVASKPWMVERRSVTMVRASAD